MTILDELLVYMKKEAFENVPTVSFENFATISELKTSSRVEVSDRVFSYLMNHIYRNRTKSVLNKRLANAYENYSSTFQGKASTQEIKLQFFQDISAPFIQSIQNFMQLAVAHYAQSADEMIDTAAKAKADERRELNTTALTVALALMILIFILFIVGIVCFSRGLLDSSIIDAGLIVTGAILILCCLCGTGWAVILKDHGRRQLRHLIASEDFDAQLEQAMEVKTVVFSVKELMTARPTTLLWGSIDYNSLQSLLKSMDFPVQKELIQLIIGFMFDESMADVLLSAALNLEQTRASSEGDQGEEEEEEAKSEEETVNANKSWFTYSQKPANDSSNDEETLLSIELSPVETRTDSHKKK